MSDRKFEQSKMTAIVVHALKRAINSIKTFAALDHCPEKKVKLREFEELLENIENNSLDVRFQSRDF